MYVHVHVHVVLFCFVTYSFIVTCVFLFISVAAENELANQSDLDYQMQTDSNGTTPDGELSIGMRL